MKNIKYIHWIIGFSGIILFLISGKYMSQIFPEAYLGNEKIRFLYRASHIYILFISVVNLFFGFIKTFAENKVKFFFYLASITLLIAFLFIAMEFFLVQARLMNRSFTLFGLISMLSGIFFYFLYFIINTKSNPAKK